MKSITMKNIFVLISSLVLGACAQETELSGSGGGAPLPDASMPNITCVGSCQYIPTNGNAIDGSYTMYNDKIMDSLCYCQYACPNPAITVCTTDADCFVTQCNWGRCINGSCQNVSYPDGLSCLDINPITKEAFAGTCTACACVK